MHSGALQNFVCFHSTVSENIVYHTAKCWKMMSGEDTGNVKKVAFCSALCAGFAYVGYSVVCKLFSNKTAVTETEESEKGSLLVSKYLSKSIQTEAPIIAGDYFNTEKSVKERVKDLNVIAQQFRKSSIPLPISPENRPRNPRHIPWSSPLGCAKYLSQSAENVSSTTPLSSPEHRRSSRPYIGHPGKSTECLSSWRAANIAPDGQIPCMQDVEITLKTLKSLQKVPRKMTLFETRNILSLLHSDDEAILVRTLSTISNCAAFQVNQEQLCNAGCPEKLFELLQHHSEPVKVAAAQAVSNIAVVEKGYRYFQPHIPLLFSYSMHGGELLKSISLTALANLALDDSAHRLMISNVNNILSIAESSNNVVQLQALRLLVNLSCNKDVVPFLLLTKVSSRFFDLMRSPGNREVTLRFLTFLANVITYAIQDLNLSSKNSTLMSFLYKMKERPEFRSIVKLSKDGDEDVSFQARRLCEALDYKHQ